MQFYKKEEKIISWYRKPLRNFILLIRDSFVFLLPSKRLPRFLIKLLYGINPKFVFFVHPRRKEDIYFALPFLVPVRKILGRRRFLKIISFFPPFILDIVRTRQGVNGFVVANLCIPEILLNDRKKSLQNTIRSLSFSSKILQKNGVFGLGGLWPMVTRRGLALTKHSKHRGIRVTNGHCGTLCSLFLTLQRLAFLGGIPFEDLKVAILGAGKMGENLARALYGKVAALTLVDINEARLDTVKRNLENLMAKTDIQKYNNQNHFGGIGRVFSNNHVGVCTTSNLTRILRPEDIPLNTIVIDDSRPEGMPRQGNKDSVAVLEGGLMKVRGLRQSYNFGFSTGENVFGCLAESFMLAAAEGQTLSPTLGKVDFENFEKMKLACKQLGVTIGDFKCQHNDIKTEKLVTILKNKGNLSSTIPFKKVCWVLKV